MVDREVGSLTIRVAVLAEAAAERAELVALLGGSPSLVVVHAGDTARDVSALLERDVDVVVQALHAPDDLIMPLDVTADLAHRIAPVVALLDDAPAVWVAHVLRHGVAAVLPRESGSDELHAAVHSAAAGLVTLTRDHIGAVAPTTRTARAAVDATLPLTPREAEVLALLADGLANKEIAARLDISAHTVKTHVQSLFTKLGADTRAEAVALGVRRGLILL